MTKCEANELLVKLMCPLKNGSYIIIVASRVARVHEYSCTPDSGYYPVSGRVGVILLATIFT